MNANSMMEQVGRLIGGLLAGSGEVYLPDVGTLYVERLAARRVSRREVTPPRRIVSYTSQERGTSLVDELAHVLETNGAEGENLREMAQSTYNRWITRAREGDTLTIEGVGVLKDKHFTPDAAFEERLNPQGTKPVRVPRSRSLDWVFWVGVVAVVCAAAIGIYAWQAFRTPEGATTPMTKLVPAQPADSTAAATTPPTDPATATTPSTASTASTSAAAATTTTSTTSAAASTTAAAANSSTAYAPATMISGHHYVVMGVFSILDNAKRAAAAAASQKRAFTCGVYRFGSKYMVSPFESTDESASRLFVRSHSDLYPDLWVYTAR